MKTEHYSSQIEKEAIDAINSFSTIDENIPEEERVKRNKMVKDDKLAILDFIGSHKEIEFNEFLKQYNEKYGYLLEHYRDRKKLHELIVIKKIAVYFFAISIISIIIGIITLSAFSII